MEWAILRSECGTVGDFTVRVWYIGRYYCQIVSQDAILLSECSRVIDINVRVYTLGDISVLCGTVAILW